MEDEIEASHFPWDEVIPRISSGWQRDEIFALANIFSASRRPSLILAAISRRLHDVGDSDTAWTIGMQALEISDGLGWSRWYDGGSRIEPFKALAKIDSNRVRPYAFRKLVEDLVEEHWLPRIFALQLDEILPLLTDELPVKSIWSEIEEYLEALFHSIGTPAKIIPGLDELPEDDTSARSISELIVGHLDHPCFAVANFAQALCAKLLLQQTTDIQTVMQERLEAGEADQRRVVVVLDAVSSRDPNSVTEFRDRVEYLTSSPDWSIRQGAKSICERCGWLASMAGSRVKQLPAIYNISLPPRDLDAIAIQIRSTSHLPQSDTDDPVQLIMPFIADIKFISAMAEVEPLNTCHRVAEIMNELSPRDTWGMEAEKQLRSNLDSLGLRLPFVRPRASLARRAIFHGLVELIESNQIPVSSLHRLDRALPTYDKDMVMAEPSPRPPWVRPIIGLSRYEYKYVDWLNKIDDVGTLLEFRTSAGSVILAEETKLKILDWELPSEVRLSVLERLANPRPPVDEDGERFFFTVVNRVVSDYGSLNIDPNEVPIIIRHLGYGFDSPGVNWLALNPTIARQFGWHLSDEGLFRWVDNQGEIMVESVWWTDGLPDHSPPLWDEVGEGWQVVGSQAAIEQIRREYTGLARATYALRTYIKDEHTERNEKISQDTFV